MNTNWFSPWDRVANFFLGWVYQPFQHEVLTFSILNHMASPSFTYVFPHFFSMFLHIPPCSRGLPHFSQGFHGFSPFSPGFAEFSLRFPQLSPGRSPPAGPGLGAEPLEPRGPGSAARAAHRGGRGPATGPRSWQFLMFTTTWGFPEMGVPPIGWFITEIAKMDDLRVPPFPSKWPPTSNLMENVLLRFHHLPTSNTRASSLTSEVISIMANGEIMLKVHPWLGPISIPIPTSL